MTKLLKRFDTWFFESKQPITFTNKEKAWFYVLCIPEIILLVLLSIEMFSNFSNSNISDNFFMWIIALLLILMVQVLITIQAKNRLITKLIGGDTKIKNIIKPSHGWKIYQRISISLTIIGILLFLAIPLLAPKYHDLNNIYLIGIVTILNCVFLINYPIIYSIIKYIKERSKK
jgi:hypothetical protein